MSSKLDRALYGPSWMEVIFGAILSIIIGVVAGFLMLALKPVITAKEIPKDAVPGQVYSSGQQGLGQRCGRREKGKDPDPGRFHHAGRRRAQFHLHGERRQGSGPGRPAPAPKPPAKGAPPAAAAAAAPAPGATSLAASHPSFRLHDGMMQVSATLSASVFGYGQDVLVQTDGRFEHEDGVYTYTPTSILIGSCPIERIPFITGYAQEEGRRRSQFPAGPGGRLVQALRGRIEGTTLKLVAAK